MSSEKVKIDEFFYVFDVKIIYIFIQNMFMNTRTEREKERKKERDILPCMLVTLFVSHLERSLLNTLAPRNTIKRDVK